MMMLREEGKRERRTARRAVVAALVSDVTTPVAAFESMSRSGETAFLFESTEGEGRLARYSIVGADPLKTVAFEGGRATVRDSVSGQSDVHEFDNPLSFLRDFLEAETGAWAGSGVDAPFSGGLVGYLGYGATRYFEGIEQQCHDPFGVPEGFYGLYDSAVIFDHQYRRMSVISYRGEEHARDLLRRAAAPAALPVLVAPVHDLPDERVFDDVEASFSPQEFMDGVDLIRERIRAGEAFQVVLAQRFSFPCRVDALDAYRVLQAVNPSPYAYILKCPGFAYIGSSPETFVKCQDGGVMLRALAGTRRRGRTEGEDRAMEAELRSDEKELAEHRMLVDLGRNDLGRVCAPGSIRVGQLATVSRYTHVMHLSTEVSGRLAPGKSAFDVFQSCFPRGTVSGAPKIRAMQILSRLEPERRGIYSGVVGYFDPAGNMDGAIAIRSALIKDGIAHVNAGAGVVFDSKPELELLETRNKGRSVVKAIKLAARMVSDDSGDNR